MPDNRKWMRKSQIAEYASVSVSTIELWMRTGQIGYVRRKRIVLFDRDDFDNGLGGDKIPPRSSSSN